MRRPARAALLCVVAIATAAAIGLAIPAAQAATNTITNPGFETGNLSGWSCDSTDSVGTGHAHSGTYSLIGAANNSSTAQCNQTVSVAANTSYTLTAFVNGAYVYLGVSGAVTASNWTPSTGGAYSQLSVTFNTGSATSVTVYLHGWYAQGTYYADDVTMNGPGGGPSPTPTTASPSPTHTTSPSPSPSRTTTSPSPTPSSTTPSGPLPKHVLTGYWQDFTN